MLYKKLSNEFKDWLVTMRKAKNLSNLILLFCNINANMKKISKQFQLYVKLNISNISIIKSLFKSYNLAPIKLFNAIRVIVVFPVFNIATKTDLDSIDIFNVMK